MNFFTIRQLQRVVTVFAGFAIAIAHADYTKTDAGQQFIADMTGQFGYTRSELNHIFSQVVVDDNILAKISHPAEKTLPWFRYRPIFSDEKRIQQGVDFYRQHASILDEVYQQYGVPPSIIVAILGVETRYGRVMGNDRVITALSTIAFGYPKRAPFFTKELRAFLQMAKQQGIDPLVPKGSYAGAMGMAQFMPSSYLHYARDYDDDGVIDLWHNPGDAIISVANYLQQHGWQRGGLIVDTAILSKVYSGRHAHKPFTTLLALQQLGIRAEHVDVTDETVVGLLALQEQRGLQYFITFDNFSVITTYNTSPMYAMAVFELAKAIEMRL